MKNFKRRAKKLLSGRRYFLYPFCVLIILVKRYDHNSLLRRRIELFKLKYIMGSRLNSFLCCIIDEGWACDTLRAPAAVVNYVMRKVYFLDIL